ncbi:MAG: transcription termination/antitermination protein NusA [Dehalococcoidales bacterium]|nr:transcription termination/antitermination protein NusA [Dehalococcoidales bacterium]
MKSDFMLAITQLSAEKNLPKEVVLKAVETALVSAYRKDNFAPNQNIQVKINPNNGKVEVWVEKTVVEVLMDERREVLLGEARKVRPDINMGDPIMIEATPQNAGRIAAQTAKQVILQRLHEAEHSAIFEEYANKEGDIIVGIVQHIEPKQIVLDIGRTEAILPASEQVRSERYRIGQRLKVYLLEIANTTRGPKVIVSRSHPNLTRRLFELEVPEVQQGIVEIKSISREAGYRSKVAVSARQQGIDPVGCCVGLRGIRIQNIVNELNGEKLDVVQWDPNPTIFIANALSPAKAISVKLDEKDSISTVVVPDKQLSLAIGKEGQNARLAAKLTGWRIDIKSASVAEAEKPAGEATPEAEIPPVTGVPVASKPKKEKEAVPVEAAAIEEKEVASPVPETVSEVPLEEPEEVKEAEPVTTIETTLIVPRLNVSRVETELRFAEDIMPGGGRKTSGKARDKKKKRSPGNQREDIGKLKKPSERDYTVHEEGY